MSNEDAVPALVDLLVEAHSRIKLLEQTLQQHGIDVPEGGVEHGVDLKELSERMKATGEKQAEYLRLKNRQN